MKTSLPPTLLLLLTSLTTAAPIPSSTRHFPPDCALTTCHPSLTRLINTSPPTEHHTPPASRPLPNHTLHPGEVFTISVKIDNRPVTPSKNTRPSHALSSKKPLSSSYLHSLTTKPSKEAQDLEYKVSHYLSTHPASSLPTHHETPSSTIATPSSQRKKAFHKPCHKSNRQQHIYLPGNVYITTQHYISRNPDIAVISIVLVFLLAILAIECTERVTLCVRRKRAAMRGEIYLADEKNCVRVSDLEKGLPVMNEESETDWEVNSVSEGDAVEFKGTVKVES